MDRVDIKASRPRIIKIPGANRQTRHSDSIIEVYVRNGGGNLCCIPLIVKEYTFITQSSIISIKQEGSLSKRCM